MRVAAEAGPRNRGYFSAGELNDHGLLTWEVGNKTITLRPTTNTARATLHVSDFYQLPEVMQVYNRP